MDTFRIVEVAVTILGGIGAAAGITYGLHKFVVVFLRNWRTLDGLHMHFGNDAADAIAELIKQIESSHGELEIRRRIVERHLQIGIYVCDAAGNTTWVNDILADAFRLDTTEMKLHGWIAAVAKDEQERVYKEWKYSVDNLLPYDVTYMVAPDDCPPWRAKSEAWPVTTKQGKLVCFVGYVVPDQSVVDT